MATIQTVLGDYTNFYLNIESWADGTKMHIDWKEK